MRFPVCDLTVSIKHGDFFPSLLDDLWPRFVIHCPVVAGSKFSECMLAFIGCFVSPIHGVFYGCERL